MISTLAATSAPCSACGAQLSPGRGKKYERQSLPDLDFTSEFLQKRFPRGASLGVDDYLRLCAELGHEWSYWLHEDLTYFGWFPHDARLALALKLPELIGRPEVEMSYTAWWGLLGELTCEEFYLHDGVLASRPTSPIVVYRGAMCDGEQGNNLIWAENPADAWNSCPGRDDLWTAELNPAWLLASFVLPGGARIWIHDSDELEIVRSLKARN